MQVTTWHQPEGSEITVHISAEELLAASERKLAVAEREVAIWKLRSCSLSFTYSAPDGIRSTGLGCAFDAGYEAAWRGWRYRDTYTSSRHRLAYAAGFRQATEEFEIALAGKLNIEPNMAPSRKGGKPTCPPTQHRG